MRDRDKNSKDAVVSSFVLVLQLGLYMIIPILVCTFLSYFIGQRLDNKYITIIGIIIGVIAGINGVYRQVKVYVKPNESPGQRARRLEREGLDDNKMDEEA